MTATPKINAVTIVGCFFFGWGYQKPVRNDCRASGHKKLRRGRGLHSHDARANFRRKEPQLMHSRFGLGFRLRG